MSPDATKPSDKQRAPHDRGDNPEKHVNNARGEAVHELGSISAKVKVIRQQQHESGQSGATGQGDKHGKFRSAKEILGGAAHSSLTQETKSKRDSEFRSKHGDPGHISIRDPMHGTRYEMTREDFLEHWTFRIVFKGGK